MVYLTLWKMMECSSVGMMIIPNIWKNKKKMFQTTNQYSYVGWLGGYVNFRPSRMGRDLGPEFAFEELVVHLRLPLVLWARRLSRRSKNAGAHHSDTTMRDYAFKKKTSASNNNNNHHHNNNNNNSGSKWDVNMKGLTCMLIVVVHINPFIDWVKIKYKEL